MSCFIHAFTVLFLKKNAIRSGGGGSSNGPYASEQPETVVWCYPRMCVVTVLVLRPLLVAAGIRTAGKTGQALRPRSMISQPPRLPGPRPAPTVVSESCRTVE
jgi:hypothetical protein